MSAGGCSGPMPPPAPAAYNDRDFGRAPPRGPISEVGPSAGPGGRPRPSRKEPHMLRRVVSAVVVLVVGVGVTMADEIRAYITKVEGDKVTFAENKGKGEKGPEKT